MNAIIFDKCFEPDDEFKKFLFEIGYKKFDPNNFEIMFDERVIEFCKDRLSRLWNEKVYKGKENYKFRCGFAGAGYIRDIDITRKWIIQYNQLDSPVITYIEVDTNKYGFTRFV